MSALLLVSFHFQADKFQSFSGGGSSASRPWEHLSVSLCPRKAVCAVLGMPCTGRGASPAVHRILILARPPREWRWRALCGAAWSGEYHMPILDYLPKDGEDALFKFQFS